MLTKWIISRIPNHEDVKNERVRSAYGKAASLVGIGCNVLLFAGKLVAGLLSGSVAIMADAVNNLSDASSSLISLLGFKLADRPADAEHPYGHGRFEYLSGMTVAVMIVAIGVELLRSSITAKNVSYNWHDPDTSFVEAALSRGDRKIADVIEAVWRAGGRMEAWSDYFRFERWMRAFEDCGLDPAFYASRERGEDEVLPWRRVNMGVRESLLLRERHRAYEAQLSPDCRAACSACGAAALLEEGRCDG